MSQKQISVLITGCGGMLGTAVYQECCNTYGVEHVYATDIDLNEPWLTALDVRDINASKAIFDAMQPKLVIHLAAHTDLEFCEQNSKDAWLTNALGTENIALLSARCGATFVYVSTAGIFDGKQEYYNDFDQPNPLSYYAKSKYYGERFVEHSLSDYFIFRAGWMMGGGPRKDKKFINKLYKQIVAGAKELYVVDDKLGTPTYTNDFAYAMLRVVESGYYGLYNQVCKGSCSRYEVAEAFLQHLGLDESITLTRVSSEYFKNQYFAPRPASEKLINLKLDQRGLNFMRDWKVCLAEYSKHFNTK